MARNPTNWSNNNVKPAVRWTPATKNASAWANNVTKKPTRFTNTSKNNSNWQRTGSPLTPNIYDSATDLYDSATRAYDYSSAQTNQLNRLNTTAWSAN